VSTITNERLAELELTDKDIARFWSKVDRRGPDECWEWSGSKNPDGYGLFSLRGRGYRSHRVSWSIAHGGVPCGMHVCHHCDNPACVNTSHLFIGTNYDNMRDKVLKGRHPNTKKTACIHGHQLCGENLYISPRGSRECRACKRNIDHARRGKSRQQRTDAAERGEA